MLTDHVSALLLCPTTTALENLRREGIVAGVHHIGDVMYDAVRFAAANLEHCEVLERLGLVGRVYAVVTIDRAENTDDPHAFKEILAFLQDCARDCPSCSRCIRGLQATGRVEARPRPHYPV